MKKFAMPEMEVEKLMVEDVITASTHCDIDGECNDILDFG